MQAIRFLFLSDHTVLMDGILANMGCPNSDVDIVIGDPVEPLMAQVIEYLPDVVVLAKTSLSQPSHCSLNLLFESFPNLVLVEVNEATGELQLIGSQKLQPKGVADLMQYLEHLMGRNKKLISTEVA